MSDLIPLSGKGVCVKCECIGDVTNHHLYPLRNMHKGVTNPIKFLLCLECHLEIEAVILYAECSSVISNSHRKKLTKDEYLKIHRNWLRR